MIRWSLLAVALCASWVALQAQEKPDTEKMRCQAQLALVRADVIDGRLLGLDQVKAKIEAANPDLVLDVQTFKLTPKAKATK